VNNLAKIAKHARTHNAYQVEIVELQKGYAELSRETCYAVSAYRTLGQVDPKSNKEWMNVFNKGSMSNA